MEIVETHFWLVCGLWVGVVGGAFYYVALAKHVAAGTVQAKERTCFVYGWAVAVMIPCLLLWGIGLSASPTGSVEFVRWPSPQRYAAVAVTVICWLVLLAWIWIGSGAAVLSRMFQLTSLGMPMSWLNPTTIKVLSIVLVVVGAISLVTQWPR